MMAEKMCTEAFSLVASHSGAHLEAQHLGSTKCGWATSGMRNPKPAWTMWDPASKNTTWEKSQPVVILMFLLTSFFIS